MATDRKLTPEELEDATKWLLNSDPVKSISDNEIVLGKLEGDDFDEKIYNYYKNSSQLQIERGNWMINVTKEGLKTNRIKGIGKNKINAYAAVPEVIKKGKIIDFNPNWKGRLYDSYIIDAPIKIGDGDFICEVIVNHHQNGDYNFYIHEVEEKKKLQRASQGGMDTANPEGASRLKIVELYRKVKSPAQATPDIVRQLETARKAGYVQGVCECVAVIGDDHALGKKLLTEMNVTKDVARKYANPETYKALEKGIFAEQQKVEQAYTLKR